VDVADEAALAVLSASMSARNRGIRRRDEACDQYTQSAVFVAGRPAEARYGTASR
jgi:hypothetical protein